MATVSMRNIGTTNIPANSEKTWGWWKITFEDVWYLWAVPAGSLPGTATLAVDHLSRSATDGTTWAGLRLKNPNSFDMWAFISVAAVDNPQFP